MNKHVQVWAQHRSKASQKPGSHIPKGTWVFLGNLAIECQEDELQRFLLDAGIDLELNRIYIKRTNDGSNRACAIISLPPEEVAHLVERAISVIPPLYDRKLRVLPANRK